METKWYSDIWQLIVAPFKRGIPQIVEHGSCRKGFYATVALALVAFVFSNILPALVGMIFGSSVAVLIYFLYLRMYIRFSDKLHYISTKYTRTGYSFADIDVVICVLILSFIYAAFRAVLSI